jgi:NAD(P)-dependent dehydrogenase (short-subunit alcohol dehydrogenase family)
MVDAAISTYGQLDCALNNAGVSGAHRRLHELDEEAWERQLQINLGGTWNCMREELPMLLEHGGAIVNMASDAGLSARPRNAGYVAVKHGIVGLTRSAALDYASEGIRVNAVCPGGTLTAMVTDFLKGQSGSEVETLARISQEVPMKRLADPSEPAEAALWLLSDRSSYVTGQCLLVDGGRLSH